MFLSWFMLKWLKRTLSNRLAFNIVEETNVLHFRTFTRKTKRILNIDNFQVNTNIR